MLGQASYQLIIIMFLLFGGPQVFGLTPGDQVERQGLNSEHYTFIFNAFVWMQLFNEINSRSLNGEINVFKGMFRNPLFCGILLITAILQAVMVQYGSNAMHVAEGGLNGELWGWSLLFGFLSLPVQQIINILYGQCKASGIDGRVPSRLKSSRRLSMRPVR